MSNGLDPDQDGHLSVFNWIQTVCKGFQQTTAHVDYGLALEILVQQRLRSMYQFTDFIIK